MLVNLNKYITAIGGTESTHRAIEVLGGNGTIETFSILPRLYRDMIVLESWEGTHNVLCLQVLRDMGKYGLHEAYDRYARAQLDSVSREGLVPDAEIVSGALDRAMALASRLFASDRMTQQAHARRLADLFARAMQAALLLAEAQWELDHDLPTIKPEVVAHFINRHLRLNYDPVEDADYIPRLKKLMMAY